MTMRAGAVLSLLVCLVAVSQGLEVLVNPEMNGCEISEGSIPSPWTGSSGTYAHSSFPSLFEVGTIPSGDVCFDYLASHPTGSRDTVSQTITITTAGTYDFSALIACYSYSSGLSCGYVLTIDGTDVPLTGSPATGTNPSIYLPVTATGMPLTAGSHNVEFKLIYATEGTVEGYVTKLSLVFVAAASGDPHMVGFQGQQFDYIGRPGQVVNLVTDPEFQVNTLLGMQKESETMYVDGPVMMQMAFMTANHTVLVNAGGSFVDEIGFVTVDGQTLTRGTSVFLKDDKLSVSFSDFSSSAKDLGLVGDNDKIVAKAIVTLEAKYEFTVFFIQNHFNPYHPEMESTSKYYGRFLDFNASLLDLDRRPHGVLGQTAAPLGKGRSVGEWTIEGKDEDYVVKDGLTGSQFSFNLFH